MGNDIVIGPPIEPELPADLAFELALLLAGNLGGIDERRLFEDLFLGVVVDEHPTILPRAKLLMKELPSGNHVVMVRLKRGSRRGPDGAVYVVVFGPHGLIDGPGERLNRLLELHREEMGSLVDEAELIIVETIVNLKDMAKCLKNIIEDYKRTSPALVTNIKKIRTSGNRELIQNLVDSYNKIFQFLRLISKFVSINVSREEFENQQRQFVFSR